MDALVTDVQIRSSVAGLRGLGRSGARVIAMGTAWNAAGRWSRYASDRVVAPDPAFDRPGFTRALGRLARTRGPFIAYPGREEAIDAIAEASSAEPLVLSPFPVEALARVREKPALAERAIAAGLQVPRTVCEASVSELRRRPLAFPCVVKLAGPVGPLSSTRAVNSRTELERVLRVLPPEEILLVQERVRGPLISLGLVVSREGRLVARFQHRACRTWPARAGSTALARSVEPNEELVARSVEMLVDAGYWGLVEVEFLEGPNGPLLVDVNPRFYGCLALALACGVNLPEAWHAVVVGGPLPAPCPYRTGVTYRWLEADLVAALRGDPGRLVRRLPRPAIGPMWASDDPLPAPLLMGTAFAKRMRSRLSLLNAWARRSIRPRGSPPPLERFVKGKE